MAIACVRTKLGFPLVALVLSCRVLAGDLNGAAPADRMVLALQEVATSAYDGPFRDVIQRGWGEGEDGRAKLPPAVRQGTINLGDRPRHVVLMPALSGEGFSDLSTNLYLEDVFASDAAIRRWRAIGGVFYAFSVTPSGDKLTVQPYTGPFGMLEVGAGGRDVRNCSLEQAWLDGPNISIDLDDCAREGLAAKVPVGDYRAAWGMVCLDGVRVTIQQLRPRPGEPARCPVFPLKIRENSPACRLTFSDRPQVVFRSPGENERVRCGQEIQVAAVMADQGLDVIIRYLEDMTRKDGKAFRVPNGGGRWFQQYVALQPTVEVRDSSGKTVAQGTMPFG